MIGKPQPDSATAFPLAEGSVLELGGRDAGSFLQAQSMNDVAALADGHWQWNGCLSAKGRVLALFALLRIDATRFVLFLPDLPAADLAAHLRRYQFRARLEMLCRDELVPCGVLDDAATQWPLRGNGAQAAASVSADSIALDFGGAQARQLLLRAPAGCATGCTPAAIADAQARWRRADLAHGLPRLGPAQHDQYTPQMLSLERLGAFSLTKGCYPGQEIVARTHYLGQSKRALQLLHVEGDAEPGAALESVDGDAAPTAAGRVVSTAADGEATLALAVASPLPPDAQLRVAGIAATTRPLLAGLAR